jgi:RNase H-fold protein (predicted Holliday junction resolvase)
VYFEEYSIVLLVLAYPKSEKDDLSNAEKKAIKKLIEEIEQEFAKGYRK